MTPKQKEVFEFIKHYSQEHGLAPTMREIKDHFGLKSFGSVSKYVDYLKSEGLLDTDWNAKRGLKLVTEERKESEIPLLGFIAAGSPIEAIEQATKFLDVPKSFLRGIGPFFALKVKGDSMIEDGILEDDLVICRYQQEARNGEIVAAVIEGEATLKHFERGRNEITLHPANKNYSPIKVTQGDFRIAGVMVGLLRTY